MPPFTNVGVDHTGSFTIRDPQGGKTKAYICIFVCTTTRAVHLEVEEKPQHHLIHHVLEAPHLRRSLATAISKKLLTLKEFTTIIKEAKNIVNSRPLTYQSDNTRDIPLTPSQLAWGRDFTLMPPLLQPGTLSMKTRAQYVVLSNAIERFRKCWYNEYLLSLREKHYNQCAKNPSHHLRVGQLVMVKHDNIHCIDWPLGVIIAVYPDERGVIRTAEVEECGRQSIRSVTFLVPLELDCHQEDDVIQQRLRDDTSGNDDDNVHSPVDSTYEAGDLGSPTTTADIEERSIPHDASLTESTSHRTPGSSRESSPTTGTTSRCNITTEGETGTPCTPSRPPPPTTPVDLQPSASEGREAEAGEPVTESRQPQRAALRQRELLRSLINNDLI